jgi:hypothetical protein
MTESGAESALAAVQRFWWVIRLRLRANRGGGSGSPAMISIPPDCWPIH